MFGLALMFNTGYCIYSVFTAFLGFASIIINSDHPILILNTKSGNSVGKSSLLVVDTAAKYAEKPESDDREVNCKLWLL